MTTDDPSQTYYVVRITRSYPDELYMPPSVQYCGREFLDPGWVEREGYQPCPFTDTDAARLAILAWQATNASSEAGQLGHLDIEAIPLQLAPPHVQERYLRALARAAWAGRA
ncbi:MAG TPA: hypothetical protein VF265_09975 [Nevskiaceae bacterium]